MAQVIIFIILLITLIISIIKGLILAGLATIKHFKKVTPNKSVIALKKTLIFITIMLIVSGGFIMFSQSFCNTPKITDRNGQVVEGSISELVKVELNGREEWISIRGYNKDNPLLLFLAGGPGGTQMAAVRNELAELEKHFVVVNWDQPGAGKSYYAIKQKDLTVDTYIEDGYELTKYLCNRFNKEKIYLVGESWGSGLGIFLTHKYPEYYSAFIGTGQMVDFLETEKIDYNLAMDIAKKNKDIKKVKKLEKNGLPPYAAKDTAIKSMEYLGYLSSQMNKNSNINNSNFSTMNCILSSEYGILDKFNYLIGLYNTFNTVYPQLYDVDFRKDFNKIDVPVYFFQGRHDINAPGKLLEEYFDILKAPMKKIIWFEHSGHGPWISESEKFIDELVKIKNEYK